MTNASRTLRRAIRAARQRAIALAQEPHHTRDHDRLYRAWMSLYRVGHTLDLRWWCENKWGVGPDCLTPAQARHARRMLNAWVHGMKPRKASA